MFCLAFFHQIFPVACFIDRYVPQIASPFWATQKEIDWFKRLVSIT